eukprot:scaffold2775_cov343-Prasinococcus_capsulatus_cf.AAC.7
MSAAADDHNEGAAGGHLASLSRVAVVREPIHRFVAGTHEATPAGWSSSILLPLLFLLLPSTTVLRWRVMAVR